MSSKVTTWPVWAAMRPIEVTRLASAPRLTSLYGLSLRIASIRSSHSSWYGFGSGWGNAQTRSLLGACSGPCRSGTWPGVCEFDGDDRRALGAVGVAGELLVAAGDVPAFEEQLGAVGEGVLDRVGVEVLVDVVAAVVPAAGALGLDRPGVLHPAALVDVVDQEVAVAAAAGPEEAVELADLVQQLADVVGLGRGERRADRAGLAVGPQQ